MAIKLQDKTRVVAPDSDFPYGDIKDSTPGTPGTPVNKSVYGDFHQFFAKMSDIAGIVLNGLYDSAYSGFQYFQALLGLGFKYYTDPIILGLLGSYTQSDVIILNGVVITLSNSNNTATWTKGDIYYNPDTTTLGSYGKVYKVAAGTTTKASGVFLYTITDDEDCLIQITHGTSGTGIADYNASTVKLLNSLLFRDAWTGVTLSSVTNATITTGSYKYKVIGKSCTLTFAIECKPITNGILVYFTIPSTITPKHNGASSFSPDNYSIGCVYYDDDSTQSIVISADSSLRINMSTQINGYGPSLDTGSKFSVFVGQITFEIV